jgi:hypothetical protein
MRSYKVAPERPEILGRKVVNALPGDSDVLNWRRGLGYLSIFAGAATLAAVQATDAAAMEKKARIPARIAEKAARLKQGLNSGACSKPELLQRQSEYRLPGQAASFNMVELLAGADNCPGAPIAPGTYTAANPFTDTGNTTGANSTVNWIVESCNGFYSQVAGADHIYSFKIASLGPNPEIRVTTSSAVYDLSIYILNGTTGQMCPANPGTGESPITNCIAGSDNTFAPGAEVISAGQISTLPLNTQLYLFIDSFYSGTAGSGPYTVRIQDITVASPFNPPANDAPVDINGDGKTDYVTVRSSGGPSGQATWHVMFAGDDAPKFLPTEWGIGTDQFVPADFDGDGKDDYAVFRPGTQGIFHIVRSGTNTLFSEPFGTTGDDATVVGDYTGDNVDDLAVYRSGATSADPSTWFYRSIGSPPGVQAVQWGQGGDFPAPGDYDGDGKYDFVVQRADANGVNGRFWVKEADGTIYSQWFGLKTDSVVPGDYDDDGKTDFAVVRNDNGILRWDFEPSGTAGVTVVSDTWGEAATDWIAQGDYDGDGKTDYAVWRPGNPGTFYVMTVGDRRIWTRIWGLSGDYPVANYNEH